MVMTAGARAVARCDALGIAPYSDSVSGLFRSYLSKAHANALNKTAEWMRDAGMTVRLDSMANLIGRYEGEEPHRPALMIASHIDSVRDAGCYDGPLGVMLGIECIDALNQQGIRLPFPIEVIAFGDEEGSRFSESMLCSRAIAGMDVTHKLGIIDYQSISVETALHQFRDWVDLELPELNETAARSSREFFAYLEAHIEQGPVLEAEDLPVGCVTGIAAQLRFKVDIHGLAGHAGTTAMHLRKDALAGAAEIMLAIEDTATKTYGQVVATVGQLDVGPGAVNVVPGHVRFSLDVRSGDAVLRNQAAAQMVEVAKAIASRRELEIEFQQVQDLPGSPCHKGLTNLIWKSIGETGNTPMSLVSGAGHDAMVISNLCPTAMLFIRCEKGISHNPAEAVMNGDVDIAVETVLHFFQLLKESEDGKRLWAY